jgi:hypothetical protein
MKRNPYLDEFVRAKASAGLDGALARLRGDAPRPTPVGAKLGTPDQLPRPSIAPRRVSSRVAALERVTVRNDERAFVAIRENSRSIDALASEQKTLADRIATLDTTLEVDSRGDLLRAFAGKLARLERRVDTAASVGNKAVLSSHRAMQARIAKQNVALREGTRAARVQRFNAAASTLQNAAYGTKGSPLATNNLLLAGNQLLWSFLGDVLRASGVVSPVTAGAIATLAPLGSLLAAEAVLGQKQHERFVSGVVQLRLPPPPPPPPADDDGDDFPSPTPLLLFTATPTVRKLAAAHSGDVLVERISLRPYIASAAWPDFVRRTDVAVSTTVIAPVGARVLHAQVDAGQLLVAVVNADADARIAWMIDTQDPNG